MITVHNELWRDKCSPKLIYTYHPKWGRYSCPKWGSYMLHVTYIPIALKFFLKLYLKFFSLFSTYNTKILLFLFIQTKQFRLNILCILTVFKEIGCKFNMIEQKITSYREFVSSAAPLLYWDKIFNHNNYVQCV